MTWKVSEVRRRFPAFANGGLGIYLDAVGVFERAGRANVHRGLKAPLPGGARLTQTAALRDP